MANSKCTKCDNTHFEVKENLPNHCNFKLLFVQCSICGSVVGTIDSYYIENRLSDLEKKFDGIKSSNFGLSSVNSNLDVISNNIIKIFNYIKLKLDNK